MKKICFITTTYITYRCFLKDFSIFLHNTGEFEIFLICGYDKTILTDVPDFVKVIQIPMKRGIDFAIWRPVIRLCSIFSKENFDLIQYSTPNAAFYASVAGWLCNTKNRLYCQWGIRYMGFSGWKRVLFQWIEKITCRCSTQIETESFQLRNFALKEGLYNDRKSFVTGSGSACGVNLQKYDRSKRESWRQEIRHTLKIGNNETVFVFAGRLTADKGINELLEAFLLLREEHEKIRLIVAGGMDHYHSLNQGLFSKATASDSVIFTGNVENLEKIFAGADILTAPSYREGFGLVVIEAAAMGLPAIVSNVPGQIDAVIPGKTGILCQVKSVSSLKSAMEFAITDQVFQTKAGREAFRFAVDRFEQRKLFGLLLEQRKRIIGSAEKSCR